MGGSEMFSVFARAAAFAAFFCVSAVPLSAQQQPAPAPAPQSSDNYKPPARFIAPAGETRVRKSEPGQSATAGSKTIGLVSVIGETFTVKKIGIMVFGNEEESFPIAGWKVDDRVASLVSRIMNKNFKVKRIQLPAGAYAAFKNGDFLFKSYDDEFARFIAKYTAGQGCEYYLVVSPSGAQVGGTNQLIGGLGVLRWSNVYTTPEHVHALSRLTVYDAQMKQLRSETGTLGQDTFLVPVKGPHVELKDKEMLPPDAKAAVADPRAQKIAWELLEQSLAKTLPKLFAAN